MLALMNGVSIGLQSLIVSRSDVSVTCTESACDNATQRLDICGLEFSQDALGSFCCESHCICSSDADIYQKIQYRCNGNAGKLASAAYPFLKEVDWTSDLFIKPLPGVSASQALKAVDKAIVMGSAMD